MSSFGVRPPRVLRVSHVGRAVTDLGRASEFYELLGFVVEEKNGGELYLKGVEEGQHHSLVLKQHSDPGMAYMAFRVTEPGELDVAREYYSSLGCRVVSEFKEKAVSDAILVERDPLGIPLVFYYDMEYTRDYRLKFHLHRGAPPLRLDHVTFALPNREMMEKAKKYVKDLGFMLTEYVEDDKGTTAMFVTKQQKPHDLAFLYMEGIHGHHHVAYYIRDAKDIFRVADIVSGAEQYDLIVAGPGRHGAAPAYYFYLRDPTGGGVVELMTDNYLILDPDKWRPVRWTMSGKNWGDYWGRTYTVLLTELFMKSTAKIVGPV